MSIKGSGQPLFCPFPSDFLWGTATSSYQIEGAVSEGGRSPSVWDTFSHQPGNCAMDHTGDIGVDHYHRFKDDVALMKDLGIQAYRFSASWSRVIPDSDGLVNEAGLDFYDRLVDELLGAGIAPWLTLFHWDLPQWAEDTYGGWESKSCSYAMADYAAVVARKLGDRLAGIFTINEFFCFLDKAYTANDERFAPGKVVTKKVLNQARHHALLAHGLSAQAVRAYSPKPIKVGLAENSPGVVPLLENAADISAAKEALRELAGMYLTPILEGAYHPAYLEDEGADAPTFTDEEMQIIGTPLDLVGLNLYAPTYVRSDPHNKRGWSTVDCDKNYPRMDMPWLTIGPSILYWAPRFLSEIWNVKEIYITENGAAAVDKITSDDEVLDIARVMYLQQHLIQAHRAASEGYPLKGYFLWSLLDNFEWATGYTKRFGIHYVNYETLDRTPKLSARYYSDVIRRNALGGDTNA